MSQDPPIPRQDDRSGDTTLVEWGAAEPTPPGRFGRTLSGLGRDRRLPPLLAALGAVAALASLLGEWQVLTIPDGGPAGDETIRVPSGVSEVGGLGGGYLIGLLALVCAVALALRGTPAVRPNARLVGLTLALTLLGLLVAVLATLDEVALRSAVYAEADGFAVEQGRGLVTAFAACLFFAAALKLAPVDGPLPTGASGPGEPADAPTSGASAGRSRRRRGGRDAEDDGPPAPADLTVAPTIPFARPQSPD